MSNNLIETNLHKAQLIAHKEILSFKEALIYLDVSESFLYKLNSKRVIDFTKPNGGKIYYQKKDLDNWMSQNTSKSTSTLEKKIYNHLEKNYNGKSE